MCGICGIFSPGSPPDATQVAAMNALLAHRGPDGCGALSDGPLAMAMRRLAIIDPAGGDQPIANEDGTVHVICNGELYGFAEQRAALELRGHVFGTGSDAEVAVHLYEERGPAFLDQLRGMFALALWDAEHRRLLLARDRHGIKPLVYAQDGDRLAFASELKALLALPWLSRDIDPAALDEYLTLNAVMAPATILRDVHRLPAGHLLLADAGGVQVRRWARDRPVARWETRRGSGHELALQLRDVLRESVHTHLVADVPVGILLSGGLDSGAIAALASERVGAGLSTFTVGFDEAEFSELDAAREVAARLGTRHHELTITPQDAIDHLQEIAQTFCEPRGDATALPYWLIAREAARTHKVVLSGEGGDELFAGYQTYLADRWGAVAAPLAAALGPLVRRFPSSSGRLSLDYRLRRLALGVGLDPLERHHAWKEILSARTRASLTGAAGPGDPLATHRARFAETAGSDMLARLQDVDLGTFLADDLLAQTDRAGMAHGLEIRVPFVDRKVMDFALALGRDAKLRGRTTKAILRDAVAPWLPRGVARGAKKGFVAPTAAWLRGPLEPYARDVLSASALRAQGVLDPAVVTRLLDEHVARREDHSRALWALLAFTLWHERWISG